MELMRIDKQLHLTSAALSGSAIGTGKRSGHRMDSPWSAWRVPVPNWEARAQHAHRPLTQMPLTASQMRHKPLNKRAECDI